MLRPLRLTSTLRVGAAAACALLVLSAAQSHAATPKRTKVVNLKTEIVTAFVRFPTPNDKKRCVNHAFVMYPDVPNAVTYNVHVKGSNRSSDVPANGPPFPHDKYPVTGPAYGGGMRTVTLKVPDFNHWFFLASGSSGIGCEEVNWEKHFKVVKSTVTVDLDGKEKPPPPPLKRRKLATPIEGPVLPNSDKGILYLENRGTVPFFYPEGKPRQPQNLFREVMVNGAVIIETPARGGTVQINPPNAGDPTYIIGPGAKVRLEAGKPIQLLEWTPGATWPGPSRLPPVRTNGMVIAARG